MSEEITVQLIDPFTQFNVVEDNWNFMLKKCPHPYYFSWGWIEIWIKSLPTNCGLKLVVYYKNQSPVAAFFIGSNIKPLHKYCNLISIRELSLHQTLIDDIDIATYVEYNRMLIDPDAAISLELILDLLPIEWDKFHMIRYSMDGANIRSYNLSRKYNMSQIQLHSFYVNLESIRELNNDYLVLVGRNRRKQIRRAIREYEKIGDIQMQIAENVDEALKIFRELIKLHQKRWTKRGYKGNFSTEYSIKFNEALIRKRFNHGEIQLIKISAGEQTIGCTYNFIFNGKAYAISGGFNYLPERYYIPGFVCDYYGIMHNSELGLNYYDFMESDDEYKKSLSTDCNYIYNIRIQKRNLKYVLRSILKYIYLKIHNIYKPYVERTMLISLAWATSMM